MKISWTLESARKTYQMHSYGSLEKMLADLNESLELFQSFKNDHPETINRIEILKLLITETEQKIKNDEN